MMQTARQAYAQHVQVGSVVGDMLDYASYKRQESSTLAKARPGAGVAGERA